MSLQLRQTRRKRDLIFSSSMDLGLRLLEDSEMYDLKLPAILTPAFYKKINQEHLVK